MVVAKQDRSRDLAVRLAGAWHSRRIYAQGSPIWQKTLDALRADMDGFFAESGPDTALTVALLGEGLAVSGTPIVNAPGAIARLATQLKARGVEIICFSRECKISELETLLDFLSADAADVSAVKASTWLKERGVDHIEIKHLKLIAGAARMESFRDVFRMGSQTLGREFQGAAKRGSVDMGPIMELSQTMLGMIMNSEMPIATLLALRDRDDFTYVHSVNVGMLAGCQAAALGMSEKEVEEINAAGLVHDIGKTRVPDAILQKKSPLSLQERALLNAHPIEGARLLYSAQGANKLAAIVAAEHHQPASLEVSDPPVLASQLVGLADVFDSLRTLAPFDQRDGMRGALVYMFSRMRSRFNPYLMTRFAALCGMFAPGDFLHLTTGEVAKVLAVHPESAMHPTVEVADRALGSLKAGTSLDLAQQGGSAAKVGIRLVLPDNFSALQPAQLDALG